MSSPRDSAYRDNEKEEEDGGGDNLNELDEAELERRINRNSVILTHRENSLGISMSDIVARKSTTTTMSSNSSTET